MKFDCTFKSPTVHPFNNVRSFVSSNGRSLPGGYSRSDVEIQLLSLPTRLGGLGINQFMIESDVEYENSRSITKDLTKAIYEQHNDDEINQLDTKRIKLNIKVLRETRNNEKLNKI